MELSVLYEQDISNWITTVGYFGLFAIVFAETGLFFCFFLPGDSLLFTAGMLAAKGVFDLYLLIFIFIIAAFLGYVMGYWIGVRFGNYLESRPGDSWYYRKSYADRAHAFMEKYGRMALFYGRLVPIVRSFIPLVAGMAKMPQGVYTLFNFLGAVLWGSLVTVMGYYLGALFPNVDLTNYLILIVLVIIFLSFLPGIIHYFKKR